MAVRQLVEKGVVPLWRQWRRTLAADGRGCPYSSQEQPLGRMQAFRACLPCRPHLESPAVFAPAGKVATLTLTLILTRQGCH